MTEEQEQDRLRRLEEALAEKPLSLVRVLKELTAGMDDKEACECYRVALRAGQRDQT